MKLNRTHPEAAGKSEDTPVTTRQFKQLYDRPRSFTDLLPWMEYNPVSRSFLLEDGVSVGALFELTPVGTEARTAAFMTQLRDAIQTGITDAIPEDNGAPWVVQVYVQDEPSLQDLSAALAGYAKSNKAATEYTGVFQDMMAAHLARICRSRR